MSHHNKSRVEAQNTIFIKCESSTSKCKEFIFKRVVACAMSNCTSMTSFWKKNKRAFSTLLLEEMYLKSFLQKMIWQSVCLQCRRPEFDP